MMGETIERPLPHSPIHERWLLGAILTPCAGFEALFDFLREDDFYPSSGAHARIFRAMHELRDRGLVVDLLSVDEALRGDGAFESVGGTAYLAALADGIARVAPLMQWAGAVREFTSRRQIIVAADLVRERAFGMEGASEVLDSAIEQFSGIAVAGKEERDDGMSPFDASVALLSELRDDQKPRIYTGIQKLDDILGGFLPGELWIFAAATGIGKTLLAQQTRRHACARGYHNVFCSGEMGPTHLQRRDVARSADVSQKKMRRNPERITEDEFRRLAEASVCQCKTCRLLTGELTIPRIRGYARSRKAHGGLSLLIIDYDELVTVEAETENDQARILARAAKAMGMEFECPVILVSQLRKSPAGEDMKRPMLQSIYGSGAKTKHSTGVLLIDRPWVRDLEGDKTDAQVYVLKNRDGETGRISCLFDVRTLEFSDGEKITPAVKKKPMDAGLFRHPAEPREAEQ
jgi:replicative DNA helicase